MNYLFKRAVRENVGLLIGLAGASGSGKTYTGMRLAAGICGDKPFVLLDTESGRALHYADAFKFDHCELHAPFRPSAYLDAIVAADKAGYPVIVVDSMSHEHAGEGGLLDWHEELLNTFVERASKSGDSRSEWHIREANNMRAWIEPKTSHKKMIQRLLQCRAHVILCFRAEEKIEIGKDEKGKTKIVPKKSIVGLNGWMPVCEKNLPYELTCSFLLTADKPGIPQPIKLQEQHKAFFPLDKPITEDSGKMIAQWAAGGKSSIVPIRQSKTEANAQVDELFPPTWANENKFRKASIEDLLGLFDTDKRQEAIYEMFFRVASFEAHFDKAGARDFWLAATADGDVKNIPLAELPGVVAKLTEKWKVLSAKKKAA